MRRLTSVLVAATLAAANSAQAQRLAVGLRGGATIASADAKGAAFSSDVGSTAGLHIGAVFAVDIARNFGFQTGAQYARRGFDDDPGVKLELTYIEIPVLFSVKLPGTISPHIYGGGILGLESGCTATNIFAPDGKNCESVRDAPATKDADAGLMFGAGVTLNAGPGQLLFDLLYNLGISDIAEFSEDADSIKNRAWYVSGGFLLPLGP